MENKIIAVNYKLYVSSATEAPDLEEETKPGQPFEFCSGLGFTLEKFEKELINLSEGDKFDFTIKAADAYGEYDEANKQDLDKSIFIVDGKLLKGKSGAAGEMHFPIDSGHKRQCTCGLYDCSHQSRS